MKRLPDFSFEKNLSKKGFNFIGGVDEVGRGPLAGPVVAGCVVFSKESLKAYVKTSELKNEKIIINDSKKLSPIAREKADKWIKTNSKFWGIGESSVGVINKLGITKATEMAFRKAINDVRKRGGNVDYLLIDAFYAPYVKGLRRKNQKAIIKGDEKSVSIAAASIIAKVYRDRLMTNLSKKKQYKKYGWDRNKGYGTKEHRAALRTYGPSKMHRSLFIRNLV